MANEEPVKAATLECGASVNAVRYAWNMCRLWPFSYPFCDATLNAIGDGEGAVVIYDQRRDRFCFPRPQLGCRTPEPVTTGSNFTFDVDATA